MRPYNHCDYLKDMYRNTQPLQVYKDWRCQKFVIHRGNRTGIKDYPLS